MRFAHRIQRKIVPGAAHNLSTSCAEAQGIDGYNAALTGDKAATLGVNCGMSSGRNGVLVYNSTSCAEEARSTIYGIDQQGGKSGANYSIDVMPTLCSDSHGTPHAVAYAPNSTSCAEVETVVLDSIGGQAESARTTQTAPTLKASHYKFPPCVMEQRGDRT